MTHPRIRLTQNLDYDLSWGGLTAMLVAGTALTFGQAVYVGADDSKMEKALANDAGTMPCVAVAVATIDENAEGEFLLNGFIRNDAWGWIPNGLVYIDKTTAGLLTQTIPVASGNQVQVVGVAVTADIILFNPSYVLAEVA